MYKQQLFWLLLSKSCIEFSVILVSRFVPTSSSLFYWQFPPIRDAGLSPLGHSVLVQERFKKQEDSLAYTYTKLGLSFQINASRRKVIFNGVTVFWLISVGFIYRKNYPFLLPRFNSSFSLQFILLFFLLSSQFSFSFSLSYPLFLLSYCLSCYFLPSLFFFSFFLLVSFYFRLSFPFCFPFHANSPPDFLFHLAYFSSYSSSISCFPLLP